MIGYPLFAAVGVWRSANVYLLSDKNVPFLRKLYVFGAKIMVCQDVAQWGVFPIGTGLGNARFTNKKAKD